MSKFFHGLGIVSITVGFLLLIGTAGSIELNRIDNGTAFDLAVKAVSMLVIGGFTIEHTEPIF